MTNVDDTPLSICQALVVNIFYNAWQIGLAFSNQREFLCPPLNVCTCLKVIEKLTDESKGTMRSNPGHETLRRGFDHIFQTAV